MQRNAYLSRINKVIDYINHNIDSELTLPVLAGVANFSPYHFHRIFKGMMGENLNDFIQRIRLEKAANLLRYQPSHSVTEIALHCGFSSSAVFARSFRGHFGVSATSYRKSFGKNCKLQSNSCEEQSNLGSYHLEYSGAPGNSDERDLIKMEVLVKSLPAYHVAYCRLQTGYEKGMYSEKITEAFSKVENWVASRNLFSVSTIGMGITYDNPDVTASDKCRYDAAFTIPDEVTDGSGSIGVQDIQGGLYAVCRIKVSREHAFELAVAKLGEAIDYLYGRWLPEHEFQLADKPCLEIYWRGDEHHAHHHVIDYCLPVLSH